MTEKYTESEKYQKEIKQQYRKRVSKFSSKQVLEILNILNIPDLPTIDEIEEASAGNVNATYLTPHLVIKLNQNRKQPDYLSNKIISDRLSNKSPVVKVIAYDNFKKTPFEVLIMKRSEGKLFMDDIFEMSEKNRAIIFKQVLDVVDQLFKIKFPDFGWINLDGKESYKTYSEFLTNEFNKHTAKIRTENLCESNDLNKITNYFRKHISIFNNSKAVFIHTDLHMHNILHRGNKLTAILDFDHSLKAPKVRELNSLIGFIEDPQQYVEGTKDFSKFKGKNFHHLLPILKKRFPEIFTEPHLLRKLNLININESIMWVSQNWSTDWNTEMIKGTIQNELPKNDLSQTYYGKILSD